MSTDNKNLLGLDEDTDETVDEINFKPEMFLSWIPPISVDETFDVERKVTNPLTTWRYENTGDADDLILAAPILTDLPATKSKFGVAFYQTARAKCFDLPATSEVWIKFDVYFDGSNRWRAYNGGNNDTTGITTQTNGTFEYYYNGANRAASFAGICKTNTLQTVLLHMKAGTSDGIIEAWVDGTFIYRYTGDVNHGDAFADIYLQSDGAGTFFSNVIISNAQIGLDEDATITVTVDYDVLRIVTQSVTVSEIFDVERRLANVVQITADVERAIRNGTTLIADVERNVSNVYEIRFDVERRIQNQAGFFFDVERIVLNRVDFTADVERKILSATTGQRMLSRISPIYDESTFMQNFFKALGVEWDKVRRYFVTLREQRFIHTVTWGIEYLEHKYSVVPDRTLTLEERRARLGLRSFKKYPLNPAVLEKFARDNFDLEVYLDESDAGYIWMFVTNFTKAGFNGYMKHLLREKPAHLALAVLLYMTLYIGRERDDGLPKLYVGIVELLTGSVTISLPKPKNQRMNIYAGVVQYWRGSMTIGSKTKPFEHSY